MGKPILLSFYESNRAAREVFDTYAAFDSATKVEGFYKIKADENQGSYSTEYYFDGTTSSLVGQEMAKALAPAWTLTTAYKDGQLLENDGRLYKVLNDYTSDTTIAADVAANNLAMMGFKVTDPILVLEGTISNASEFPATPSNGGVYIVSNDITVPTATADGEVSVSGTTVTRTSGDSFVFDGSWDGRTITIDSSDYTISEVTDADTLTVTVAPGDGAGLVYSVVTASVDYKAGDELLFHNDGDVEVLGNVMDLSDYFNKTSDNASDIAFTSTEGIVATNAGAALDELKLAINSVAVTFTQGYEASRGANIAPATDYTLPNSVEYVVGSNDLAVYVEGQRFWKGIHFNEVGTPGDTSAIIQFVEEIDKVYGIAVEVRVI